MAMTNAYPAPNGKVNGANGVKLLESEVVCECSSVRYSTMEKVDRVVSGVKKLTDELALELECLMDKKK